MDASSTTQQKKSKVYYTSITPNAECSCSTIQTAVLKFPSYEEKQLYKEGEKTCCENK